MWFLRSGLTGQDIYMRLLTIAIVIFLVTPIHECAHAWTAYKLGDPTAKNAGRITLNPISSIDWRGAIFIVLFGFGWGKPVLVNPYNFKHPKRDMALTALAGPATNFIAAFVCAIIFNLITRFAGNSMSYDVYNALFIFFYYLIAINITLCIFNLIPIPPLDGSKVLSAFLSDRASYAYQKYQNYYMILILILCFTGMFGRLLGGAQSAITIWMMEITSFA